MIEMLTDSNLTSKLKSHKTSVIIYFYADWCQPCKSIAPIIEKIAEDYEGRLTIVKVNAETSPKSVQLFHVSGIPTLVFIGKDKQAVSQLSGFHSREVILKGVHGII